jgi:predicted nuclease of restriction endonuclease-like (RecB) superfamily
MKIQPTINNPLFENIVKLLHEARKSVLRNINRIMVYAYYEIGRMIVEDEQNGKIRAEYGKQTLIELSGCLSKEFGKGYSVDNLGNMRKFYLVYSKTAQKKTGIENTISETVFRKSLPEKSETLSRIFQVPDFQLSWSHYLKLLRIDNEAERQFYELEANANQWSLREMKRQYDSALYQRLVLSRDKEGIKKLSDEGHKIEKPHDAIKDPYILEFVGLPEETRYSESEFEQKLIDRIEHFLLELGKGFAFVGRQVRITVDEKHFRVDLVFYNRFLKSFVLVDLKIGELKHQDIGQMQMYVNYYDRFIRLEDENKTVGIILCRDKSEALVNITLPENNEQIFASKYRTVLPSKEELKKLIENKE